jgi:hypothetical protein
MAGIVLPVVIHFWNDRRGKVLRIGSISFLEGASQRMSWSRRISDWWLLLLRCLLLMALALLLAGPYWVRKDSREKGWVLADAGAMNVYGARIDSLVKAGWEKRELDSINYWNGFRTLDRMAPAGLPFVVFSSGLESRYMGSRPVTNRDIHWEVYAPKDSVNQWTEKAWGISPDSARVMSGVAKTTGSVFHYATVAMKADTGTLDLTIYADGVYKQDGLYLEAALRAVQEFTHRRMRVMMMGSIADGRGWLFWLSAKPLPEVKGFSKIWQYGRGDERKIDTWMEGTEVYKEIIAPRDGEVVWKDGYGRGVLVRGGEIFSFYSRLDPDWGELVWSRQFPALLAKMLFGEEGPGVRDLRMMDLTQVAPVRRAGGAAKGMATAGAIDLGMAGWILIFLLFILERWLSGRE